MIPPLGLLIDHSGAHFDPAQPSDLEQILRDNPLDDTALLNRARGCIARMQETHLTKYTAFDTTRAALPPGYVVVIDQTFGDASVRASGADRNRFLEMLFTRGTPRCADPDQDASRNRPRVPAGLFHRCRLQ